MVEREGIKTKVGKELLKQMHKLQIFEKDIKEQFIHSSGPGGQNVNKVSSCVQLKHIPTGIIVKCQSSRAQSFNRQEARQLLIRKISFQQEKEKEEFIRNAQKLKRKKRNRPKGIKEQILQNKHRQSEKKEQRRKINSLNLDKY